ncbi:condensin complex subunit 2-domain-containing protein [Rhexocercosporidium sp. MPI-PUGE-AT-0058]|nr:condensin complex subunit 2-domain-containing protein [Rhexocercosporidium sp. MPI-PUGE-AT-0058]
MDFNPATIVPIERGIPLNDDAQEKAKRLQSRHALYDIHMNQIKAAASPMRKLTNFEPASSSPSSNPKTPRRTLGKENDLDGGAIVIGGTAVTPLGRVPILANFEEWMKMATDNKINAANSWTFALIDYFYDICVKIYTSRVDSVAAETGKLLSGLAGSGNSKKNGESEEGEENEEAEVLSGGSQRSGTITGNSSQLETGNATRGIKLESLPITYTTRPDPYQTQNPDIICDAKKSLADVAIDEDYIIADRTG